MKVEIMDVVSQTLAIRGLSLVVLEHPFEQLHTFDYGLRDALDPAFDWQAMGNAMLEAVPERTLLIAEGTFGMRYLLFRLPDEEDKAYIIGPWRNADVEKQEDFLNWLSARTSQQVVQMVKEHYNAIYLMQDEGVFVSFMFAVLSAAYPHIDGRDDFHIESVKEFLPMNFSIDDRFITVPEGEPCSELTMTQMEERYKNEEQFMEAVAQGDSKRAVELMNERSRFRYSNNRLFGDVQQGRMRQVILNVLLRKSIERAQVHPYYIDQISGQFYNRIVIASPEELKRLSGEMIHEYCRYVREYSLRQYSPLVQKTVNYINLNLSAQLSLRTLAEQFFISPSYLSNLFRTEMGVTLVDYINTRRMAQAARLLTETNLSVTSIAEQVGIVDVNYFTKIFKKNYQMPPTQYRRSSREKTARLAP